jgi:hypothetical protein
MICIDVFILLLLAFTCTEVNKQRKKTHIALYFLHILIYILPYINLSVRLSSTIRRIGTAIVPTRRRRNTCIKFFCMQVLISKTTVGKMVEIPHIYLRAHWRITFKDP